MQVHYVNPYTDFGFKKIFCEEASKPLLIDFLNSLLPEKHKIKDLQFKNTEQFGQNSLDRRAIYDIYCESSSGEKFIVELQKVKQNFFKDRMVYYSTFPIREQAPKGSTWTFELQAIYCIGILDFTFDDYESEPERSEVVHTVKLKNQNNKVFYDKLTFIYMEMPNFNKSVDELSTRLDQWLYFIRNLEDTTQIPGIFKDEVFVQAFNTAALATLSHDDYLNYERNLNAYRDYKNSMDTAFGDGKAEGKVEGKAEGIIEGRIEGKAEGLVEGKAEGRIEAKKELAKRLKASGMDNLLIQSYTDLSIEEIEAL